MVPVMRPPDASKQRSNGLHEKVHASARNAFLISVENERDALPLLCAQCEHQLQTCACKDVKGKVPPFSQREESLKAKAVRSFAHMSWRIICLS